MLGTTLAFRREWRDGHWRFNPDWADLGFEREGYSPDAHPDAILRGSRYRYTRAQGPEAPTYRFGPSLKLITQTATGWRWTDRLGNWVDYDDQGQAARYGNRNGIVIRFVRDGAGRIHQLLDPQGEPGLTITYDDLDRPLTVTGRAGRAVSYRWQGDDLAEVTDVLGGHWRYRYQTLGDERVIRERIDPLGRALTLDHIFKPGGHQCVPTGEGQWTHLATHLARTGGAGSGSGSAAIPWHWTGPCTEIANQGVVYLRSMSDTLGLRSRYRYTWDDQNQHYLIAREDGVAGSGGVLTQSWYNRDGQLLRRQVNDQLTHQTDYDGRWETRIDSRGLRTRIENNRFDRPLHVRYPDGSSQHYQYDLRNLQLTQSTDANGIITAYQLDDHGNRLQTLEAQGTPTQRSTRWTYDSDGLPLTRTREGDADTEAATTTWSYDADGNQLTETDAEGHTTRYHYDRLGRVTRRTDANGGEWTYQYDAAGNRLQATDPLGHTSTASYDALGNRLSRTDANGHTTTWTYDQRGRLTRSTDPEGHSETYTYDLANRLIQRTDQTGLSTTLTYNRYGHLARITDPAGNTITLDYDAGQAPFGQPTTIHYPTYSEQLTYDLMGRVRQRSQTFAGGPSDPAEQTLTTHYRFDKAGNRIATTDPAGRTSQSRYDALDRLIQQTAPDSSTVGYRYDNRDNLIAVTNRKQVTIRTYRYDKTDQKTQETWPDGQTTRYAYDPNGNLTQKTDAKGQITRHAYDRASQLTQTDYYPASAQGQATPPTKTVRYSYDNSGNLLSYDDGDTQGRYSYDNNDRQRSQTIDYGPFQATTDTTYTPDGKKRSQRYPDGQTIGYRYNTQTGQLYAVNIPGAGLISFQGYTWTAINKTTYPGVTVRTVEHDGLLRPTHIKVTDYDNTRTYLDYRYKYSTTGNITEKQTEHGDYRYGYDTQDRLTNVDNPDSGSFPDERYAYDAAGNRTQSQDHDDWHYNSANQLQTYGDKAFAYDANGSTVTEQQNGANTRTSVYNLENRLSEVKDENGNTLARYGYDPFGRRVWKETGGTKHYYLYSDEGLIAELNSQGRIEQKYGWMPDSDWGTQPLWTYYQGRWAFFQTDHLGTPWMLIDDFKRVAWEGRYQAFGEVTVLGEPLVRNLVRFPGQVHDEETGENYNLARYYDHQSGQYSRSDPIGLAGGPNSYGYAASNPVFYTDPTGEVIPAVIGLFHLGRIASVVYTRFIVSKRGRKLLLILDGLGLLYAVGQGDIPGRGYCRVRWSPSTPRRVTFSNRAPTDPIRTPQTQSISNIVRTEQSGRFNYIVTTDNRLVIGRSGRNRPNGHIDLAQGVDVLAAGEARFVNGQLRSIDNASGHYRPSGGSARSAAEAAFERAGLNASGRYIERSF